MNQIEELIEQLGNTKDGAVLSKLNQMGVSVIFLPEGIRWTYNEK